MTGPVGPVAPVAPFARPRVEVRPRHEEDLPALVALLAEQQPHSGYPLRWPLPFDPERFVRRDDEWAAWVAEVDGEVAGHACVQPVGSLVDGPEPDLVDLWAQAHGRVAAGLGCLSALFVGHASWGRGVGGLLHDVAVGWLREHDLGPCIEVLPRRGGGADRLYAARGWRTVGDAWPAWLPEGAGPVRAMVLPERDV